MQTILHWKGCEYTSRECCLLTAGDEGVRAEASIRGSYGESVYQVKYTISTNSAWEVIAFSIENRINGRESRVAFKSDGAGNWTSGQEPPHEQFSGCTDIDISLTPFTNTLPIRRLGLAVGEAAEIQVLYLDLLKGETRPVRQKYTRMSQTEYRYENVPNDFEALITVDGDGLVADYPGLFKRESRIG